MNILLRNSHLKWSPVGGALMKVLLMAARKQAGKRKIIISTSENFCHIRILSPAFKKRKKDPSLPQQQHYLSLAADENPPHPRNHFLLQ